MDTRSVHVCCCHCQRRVQTQPEYLTSSTSSSARRGGSSAVKQEKRRFYSDCCTPKWLQVLLCRRAVNSDSSEEEYDLESHRKSNASSGGGGGGKRPSQCGTDCNSIGGDEGHCSETSPFLPGAGRRTSRRKSSNDCCSIHSVHNAAAAGAMQFTTKAFDIHSNNNETDSNRDDVSDALSLRIFACLEKGIPPEDISKVRIQHRRCSPIPVITLDRHTQTKHSKTVTWQCPACTDSVSRSR